MRFAISTFLTIAFIFGFAIAQEDQIPDTILPDELETVEPLDDSEILDSSNPPEEVQPFTEDLEEAVPENPKPNNASPSQAVPAEQEEETEQPEQTMLPEGISEEEARWANWADWDNVGAKPDEKTDTVIQQDLIAPQTDEDAIEDSSRLMDQSAVPEINKIRM